MIKRWITTEMCKGERKVGVAKEERGARGDDPEKGSFDSIPI